MLAARTQRRSSPPAKTGAPNQEEEEEEDSKTKSGWLHFAWDFYLFCFFMLLLLRLHILKETLLCSMARRRNKHTFV